MAPGTSLEVDVLWNLNDFIGHHTAELSWDSSDGDCGQAEQIGVDIQIVGGGTPAYTVTPNPDNFGALKVGQPSAARTYTIKSTGSSAVTISTIVVNGAVTAQFALQSLPTLPIVLNPGDTTTFQVVCTPAEQGIHNFADVVDFTSDASSNPPLALGYTGFLINSAFILTGATKGVLYSLSGTWNSTFSTYVAEGDDTLACEADSSLTKQYDFDDGAEYNYLNRVFLRVEPLGVVTVSVADQSIISGVVSNTSDTKSRVATNDSTGILDIMIFDIQQNGELHKVTISVAANAGLLSITKYVLQADQRGEVYEGS